MFGRRNSHDSDMTKGSVWKQIVNFSLPMVLGLIFQQLYNTVDAVVVGKFVGPQALAAVGITANVFNVLVTVSAGLATGATVLISQLYGAHNEKRLSDAVQTTIALTFASTLLCTFGGLLLTDPLLKLMQTPDDVYQDSRTYLIIYFSGVGGLLFYNMGSGILRAVGDSKRPLYFLIFSASCNIVLDLIFVLVFDLGVAGVAFATIGSQLLSAVMTMAVLTKAKEAYGIRWNKIRFVWRELRQILALGLPTALQQGITSFSNIFVQGYINILGSSVMAGYTAYGKVDCFALLPLQALSMASSTFVGQNYGAKQLGRARKGVQVSLFLCISVTAVLGAVAMLAAPLIARLFTDDAEVLQHTVFFVRIVTPFYLAMCVIQILSGSLRGIGQTVGPTIIILVSHVAFRQVFLYFNKLLNAGTELYNLGVGLAYPVGWTLSATLLLIVYLCSKLHKAPAVDESLTPMLTDGTEEANDTLTHD